MTLSIFRKEAFWTKRSEHSVDLAGAEVVGHGTIEAVDKEGVLYEESVLGHVDLTGSDVVIYIVADAAAQREAEVPVLVLQS